MKLITSYTSPFGRKVRIVLAEKRIECQLIEDNPWAAESSVSALNPLGKVPILLLDDGRTLYDSRVIVDFLDHSSPVGKLIPSDHRQAISIKRREALADGISDAAVLIRQERIRPPHLQSTEWIEHQQAKIERGLEQIASELDEKKWWGSDLFSLADVALGCTLAYIDFRLPELGWQSRYPNLQKFYSKLEERPSFTETAPPMI
ncbi:glutathione S-transferase [Iodobacter sp. HSC-16F04]|uniref:Glutathione S-transferase n=1 Tax=Iodobacter violaceini TaxID=3044271 RepID=A0ABX0KTI8_9NEIS|nr:glutathione S-transferase [Iodobacter violacea]NHQ86023.1 glutathione S-transferase [Iodobacter violacea]